MARRLARALAATALAQRSRRWQVLVSAMTSIAAETLTRPSGKLYRPRTKVIRTRPWDNDEYDGTCGVIVFGTLDPAVAHVFAAEACQHWYTSPVADNPAPVPGWWRDGFWYGERRWAYDDLRGAPGVMFWAEA